MGIEGKSVLERDRGMVQTQERDCAKEMVSVQVCVHCGILKVGREGEMKRLGFSSLFHPSPICLLSPSPPHLLREAHIELLPCCGPDALRSAFL